MPINSIAKAMLNSAVRSISTLCVACCAGKLFSAPSYRAKGLAYITSPSAKYAVMRQYGSFGCIV